MSDVTIEVEQRNWNILFSGFVVFCLSFLLYSVPGVEWPFSSHGEAREALVVKNMIEQANFILPLRAGTDIPSKPPLFHWLAVLSTHVMGFHEAAIRLPSALSGALLVAFTFCCVARVFGRSQAVLSALMLGTAFEWSRSASIARVDMVFTLFENISLLFLFVALTSSELKKQIFSVVLGGACLGLATLAKGPAGLVLPLATGAVFLLSEWKARYPVPWVRSIVIVGGICVIGTLLAGTWYWLAYLQGGKEFLQVQLMKENFARLTHMKGYDVGHVKPFYFSLIDLLVGMLPWGLALPILWRLRKRSWTSSQARVVRFLLSWIGLLFLAVTVSSSKRPVYLIPIYPALIALLATAFSRDKILPRFGHRLLGGSAVVVGCLMVAAFLFSLSCGGGLGDQRCMVCEGRYFLSCIISDAVLNSPYVVNGAIITGIIIAIGGRKIARGDESRGVLSFGAGLAFLILIASRFVQPNIAENTSPVEFLRRVASDVPLDKPLLQFQSEFYPLLFYAQRPIGFTADVRDIPVGKEIYLVVRQSDENDARARLLNSETVMTSSYLASEGTDYFVVLKGTPAVALPQ